MVKALTSLDVLFRVCSLRRSMKFVLVQNNGRRTALNAKGGNTGVAKQALSCLWNSLILRPIPEVVSLAHRHYGN